VHQIESSWAGLRPLIHKDGKSPSELSRKDEIFVSESGLISIAGGKLTGYRKMAEKIVDIVVRKTGVKVAACTTAQIPVFGANFQHSSEISELIIQLSSKNKKSGLNVEHIKGWVHRYGTETIKIINYYSSINAHNGDCGACALLAELSYGVDKEMVMCLEDFYIRRSAKLYFDLPNVLNYLDDAGKLLCEKLGYSEEEIGLQKLELKRHIALVTDFKR
jgi:glycerol-3-phosphate dehydrogenase